MGDDAYIYERERCMSEMRRLDQVITRKLLLILTFGIKCFAVKTNTRKIFTHKERKNECLDGKAFPSVNKTDHSLYMLIPRVALA